MSKNDASQKIVGRMINELLKYAECNMGHRNDEELSAVLSTIIDSHGQNLPAEKSERLVEQAQLVQAFLAGCAQFDKAKEAGDPAAMKLWREEIERVSEQQAERAAFLNFTYAAEQLCKAQSIDEFKTILPSVPLDRIYGGASSAKQVSPFPLIWALSTRSQPLERVQLMLAAGARVDLKAELSGTVLHAMAKMKRKTAVRLPIISLLVFNGADLEARNSHDQTPLTVAIDRGSVEDVGHFLAAGAKVRRRDLEFATRAPKKLRLILDHLADEPDQLEMAAQLGGWLRGQIADQKQSCKYAIKKGAKGDFHRKLIADLTQSLAMIAEMPGYSVPDDDTKLTWQEEPSGFVTIKTAVSLDKYRVALARVDIRTFDMAGDHPIYWPIRAKEDRLERLWLMLSAGASVKGASGDGEALHIFARESRKDTEEQFAMAHMLTQSGANLEAVDYNGLTPLGCALGGLVETTALLRLGADPDVKISWSKTLAPRSKFTVPLVFAAAFDARVFKLLIDGGARIQGHDSKGRSLRDFLQETLEDHEGYLNGGNMSGNLERRLKRSWRALSKSLEILGQN